MESGVLLMAQRGRGRLRAELEKRRFRRAHSSEIRGYFAVGGRFGKVHRGANREAICARIRVTVKTQRRRKAYGTVGSGKSLDALPVERHIGPPGKIWGHYGRLLDRYFRFIEAIAMSCSLFRSCNRRRIVSGSRRRASPTLVVVCSSCADVRSSGWPP
jgi:hypothetical protein